MKAGILKTEKEYNEAFQWLYSMIHSTEKAIEIKDDTFLNRHLGIPLELLIVGNQEIRMQDEKKVTFLNISSIRKFLNDSVSLV